MKEIPGYEGLYSVTNNGKVYSHISNKWLKPGLNSDGYPTVVLRKNKKPKTIGVHRLVAVAFIENPENKPYVNHIDGNKTNNYVYNLEWVTPSENVIHAYTIGLENRDSLRKLLPKQIADIHKLYKSKKYTYRKLAQLFQVSCSRISDILNDKAYKEITALI
jgi:hypothetical protein